MDPTDRRTFLKATGATLAASALTRTTTAAEADAEGLEGVEEGLHAGRGVARADPPPVPAPEGRRIRGGGADQPERPRSRRGASRPRQDGDRHPRRQRLPTLERHPLRPRPRSRRARDGGDPPGDGRLQGVRGGHGARRPRRGQQAGVVPRRLHPVAGPDPQAASPTPSGTASRSPSRRSGTSSCSAPSSSPATSTSSRAPGSSPTSTSATSSSSATPRSGSASSASASRRSTSRSTPSRNGSATSSARRGARSTGPPSARRSSRSATKAGSRPRCPTATSRR